MTSEDNPAVATSWDRFRMKWFHRYIIEDRLYGFLSDDDCGNHGVPINHRKLEFRGRHGLTEIAMMTNDAGEIGLGWPERWHYLYARADFHRIVRWYLRLWIFSEWLGLRRWLWYKLLFRRIKRARRHVVPIIGVKEMDNATNKPSH